MANDNKQKKELLMSGASPYNIEKSPPPAYSVNAIPFNPNKQKELAQNKQNIPKNVGMNIKNGRSKSFSPRSEYHDVHHKNANEKKKLDVNLKHNKSEDSIQFDKIVNNQHKLYHDAVAKGNDYMNRPDSFSAFWVCARCTYGENPGTFLVCGVCGATRQLSMPLRRQHSLSDPKPPVMIPQSKSECVDSLYN